MPPCGSCLAATLPPRPGAALRDLAEPGRGAAQAFLELTKRVVLNEVSPAVGGAGEAAVSPLAKVDGHAWPAGDDGALTMVGRRRLDHLHALIDDVVFPCTTFVHGGVPLEWWAL